MKKDNIKLSKYLSFILRHQPDAIGLRLDDNGWASIDELIEKTTDFQLDYEIIHVVVETNDKQRFAISENGEKIRANQGHSIEVDLALKVVPPPERLLHGTADRFLAPIFDRGLIKGDRHHVHLTESEAVALSVGGRYGKSVLLAVNSGEMHSEGYQFYKTANGVWLVEHVPAEYLHVL